MKESAWDGIGVRRCYTLRMAPGWKLYRHVHAELSELFLVEKGCLLVDTPSGALEVPAHHAVLYPRGLTHYPSSGHEEPLEMIAVEWTGEVGAWDFAKLVQPDRLGRIRHQLMWMLDTVPGGRGAGLPVLDLLGRSVLVEFERLCSAGGHDMTVRARRFMRENLGRPVALADVSRAVGLNRCYFARAFKKATGQSPMRALQVMRVEAARDMILRTVLPLKQIARLTGFADEVHLSHAFRRLLGHPPGRLRRGGHAGL